MEAGSVPGGCLSWGNANSVAPRQQTATTKTGTLSTTRRRMLLVYAAGVTWRWMAVWKLLSRTQLRFEGHSLQRNAPTADNWRSLCAGVAVMRAMNTCAAMAQSDLIKWTDELRRVILWGMARVPAAKEIPRASATRSGVTVAVAMSCCTAIGSCPGSSQRCHLGIDRPHHLEVQRRNREQRRRRVQPALLEIENA